MAGCYKVGTLQQVTQVTPFLGKQMMDAFSVFWEVGPISFWLLAVQAPCASAAVSQVSKALLTQVGSLLKLTVISSSAKIYNLTNK